MSRDIEQIKVRLEAELPRIQIRQLQVVHPGVDDDGLWFIRVSGRSEEIQIESLSGNCPFLIESDLSNERIYGATIDEVVSTVRSLISVCASEHPRK